MNRAEINRRILRGIAALLMNALVPALLIGFILLLGMQGHA